MATIYLETTIPSYWAGRPRNLRLCWLGILFFLAGGTYAEPATEPFLVGGRVLPVAGASTPPSAMVVELRPAFPGFDAQRAALHGADPDALATARVGEDGTFLLIVPKQGVYRIDARAQGFRSLTIPFLPLVEPIQLAHLKPVTALPLAVQVHDPNGQPAGGVTVRVVSPTVTENSTDPNAWRPLAERSRSDSQGRAVVYREAGPVQVLAETTGATARQDVPADATWTVMNLTARPSLSLAVRDSAGRPASGALVYAAGSAIAGTDEDGHVVVPSQSAESAPLLVVAESGEWAEVKKAPSGGGKAPVAVRLGPPRKALGVVLALTSETPLPQSLVWVRGNGAPGRGGVADTRGDFEILFAGSGPPVFGAAATGHAWREISAAPPGPRDAPLTLRLNRATDLKDAVGLTGTVADFAGMPIAGAEVFAVRTVETRTNGRRTKERFVEELGTSDLQGGFHAEGLLPGAFDLLARANGYVSGRVGSLQIPAGSHLPNLRMALSQGQRIEGRLRDSSGQPVAGVTIEAEKVLSKGTVIAEVERPRSTAVSDRDGMFTLTGLEPGNYQVTAESPLGTASGSVAVGKEGGRIELQLKPSQ